MYSIICAVSLIFIATCLQNASGYTWIAMTSNDLIPENAVKLNSVNSVDYGYVGRARHRNLVLPAQIYNSSLARIAWNSKIYDKNEFEILIADEFCEWIYFGSLEQIPDNVVRAGSDWNGEPIYVGGRFNIFAIFMSSNRIIKWPNKEGDDEFALVCDDKNNWVDAISGSPPDNAVYGGRYLGASVFVGRLLEQSSYVPGQVIPSDNKTTAFYNGAEEFPQESPYCEILLGGPNEYIWKSTRKGQIPDYAVVGGRSPKNEIRYVAKNIDQGYLGYVEYDSFSKGYSNYKILVRKVTNT